ncbi:MAG: YrdB family protein [Saprospiraceae bacterium]
MGSNPINLALRFLLELSALAAVGVWGWKQSDGWFRYVLAIGIPLILAGIWGTFAVPDDPSRSGAAPVATPGLIRLALELGIFAFGTWALYNIDFHKASLTFGIIVLLHYVLSYDRIMWLMSH